MATYEKLANFIIDNVGGKENIENITHCMTRLRIKLKDPSKANRTELDNNKEIVSTQIAEGKLQVIIGTHVADVYEEVIRQLGGNQNVEDEETKGSLMNRFAALITKIVVPSLGVLCACGIISGLNSVLVATGLIQSGDGTYLLLNAMGNACLTFFPIILGYTSAKAFGMDPFIGMIMGCVLVFPGLSDSINSGDAIGSIFSGAMAMPIYKTFFGIPIIFPSNGYTSTVIPIILVNFIASKLEKWLKEHMPAVMRQFLVPFGTILVGCTIGILLIGPISMTIQNLLSICLNFLIAKSKILATIVITAIYQPLVVFGLHWPLISLGIVEYMTNGCSLIVGTIFPASFTHMAACLATFFRTKSTKMKNISFPAFLSACFCIIEPSIYGVTLPVKKRFGFCIIGGIVGGLILMLTNSAMYSISMGVTGFVSFVNPTTKSFMGMIWAIVACASAFAVTFILTWMSYKPGEDGKNEDDVVETQITNVIHKKEVISSPLTGTIKPLSEMKDKAFANNELGKGICITPSEGKIVAPCDGQIVSLFPTGHAIGIKSNDGAEILIHVGTDSFNLPKDIFNVKVQQNQFVKAGDLLVEFEMDKLKKAIDDIDTAVIVTNSKDYFEIIPTTNTEVKQNDLLLTTIVSKEL